MTGCEITVWKELGLLVLAMALGGCALPDPPCADHIVSPEPGNPVSCTSRQTLVIDQGVAYCKCKATR